MIFKRVCRYLPLFFLATQLSAATILITGANRGIGLEFARQYSARGDTVIGTARSPDKAVELKDLGVRVEQLDVTDQGSVQALAKRLEGVAIDRLINNAGVFRGRQDGLEDLSMEDFDLCFAVNATGVIRVSQAMLPNLRQGEMKQLIHISSQLGSITNNTGGMYAYRASKAALNQIHRTLSQELGSQGFSSVALHPGWVQTDMGGSRAPYTPQESVRALIATIDRISPVDNGAYLDLNGEALPW
jgi:NAD(P)-dependent dehydrogenase (short-subunit alcohol dehydrogenase family)